MYVRNDSHQYINYTKQASAGEFVRWSGLFPPFFTFPSWTQTQTKTAWLQPVAQIIFTTSTLFLFQRANHEHIHVVPYQTCLACLSLTVHSIRFRAAYLCHSVHSMLVYTSHTFWSVPTPSQMKLCLCVTGSSQDIDDLQKNNGES